LDGNWDTLIEFRTATKKSLLVCHFASGPTSGLT
jgi:hypothetical protein